MDQGIYIRFAAYVFDPHHPGLPVEVAIGWRAGEMDGIVFALVGPLQFIGGAAMFEFVAMECIGLVEDPGKFRHDHIVERTALHGAAAGLRAPIHFEGSLEQEFGMILIVVDNRAITQITDIHSARRADQCSQ